MWLVLKKNEFTIFKSWRRQGTGFFSRLPTFILSYSWADGPHLSSREYEAGGAPPVQSQSGFHSEFQDGRILEKKKKILKKKKSADLQSCEILRCCCLRTLNWWWFAGKVAQNPPGRKACNTHIALAWELTSWASATQHRTYGCFLNINKSTITWTAVHGGLQNPPLCAHRSQGWFLTSTKAVLSETHVVNVQAENMQNTWLASEKWQLLTIQFKLLSPHIWYSIWTPAMQVYRSELVTTVTDRPMGGNVSWNGTPHLVSLCTAGRTGPQISAYCNWSKECTMLPCSLLRT